jgi:hypothetical protein
LASISSDSMRAAIPLAAEVEMPSIELAPLRNLQCSRGAE